MDDETWTVREAADALDIAVSFRTFAVWVRSALEPVGKAHTSGRGRPAYRYRRAEVEELYERRTQGRTDQGEFDD